MEEAAVLLMILSGIIMVIAWRAKSRLVMFIGSIGWIITGLQFLLNDPDMPAYTFLFCAAIAAAPFLLVNGDS